jgi:single-strand DNA-binding protein
MSGSVNRALIVGNLGADPEIRDLPSGQKVANLTVATNERWKDRQSGEARERTEWHSVSVFDPPSVRYAEQYLRKGAQVYVEGRVQTRKWQDQAGADRYSTEIVVNTIGGKLVGLSVSNEAGRNGQPIGNGPSEPDIDDIIPF